MLEKQNIDESGKEQQLGSSCLANDANNGKFILGHLAVVCKIIVHHKTSRRCSDSTQIALMHS